MRVGLIGCGGIARLHVQSAERDPRVEIVAYADVREEAAQRFLAEHGGEYATGAPDEVIADDSLDAVVIATHHDSHAPLAIAAAEAGRHVLLEKPMATTGADAVRIARAVEEAGVCLALNYKFRLETAVRRARLAIEAPSLLVVQLAMGPIDESSADAWVFDPHRGGGLTMATGTHLLDLLLWLARSDPVRISATGVSRPGRATPVSDVLAGTVTFESGAIAAVTIADVGENDYVSKWFCELFDGTSSAVLYERLSRVQLRRDVRASEPDEIDGPPSMLSSLANAVLEGRQVEAGPADGVRAVLLAEALVEAAVTGLPVDWGSVVARGQEGVVDTGARAAS